MSNNTTACWTYPKSLTSAEQFVSYKLLIPIYFVIDLVGRALFLAAVYKHSQKEKTYFFQVVRAVVEALQVPFRTLICIYDAWWSTDAFVMPRLIAQCYPCIWIFSRILFVINVFNLLTLLLAVCMAADRVFALVDAHKHATINRRVHQRVALWSCVALSFALAAVDFARFDVYETSSEPGSYNIRLNPIYSTSTTLFALGLVRTLALAFLTVLLIVLNAILLRIYRVRFVTNDTIVSLQQLKRKQSEKALLMLTLLECSFMMVEKLILAFAALLVYVFPGFYLCIKPVWIPAYDGVIMVNDLIDFYAALLICKQFRQMVRKVFPCWHENVVTPLKDT